MNSGLENIYILASSLHPRLGADSPCNLLDIYTLKRIIRHIGTSYITCIIGRNCGLIRNLTEVFVFEELNGLKNNMVYCFHEEFIYYVRISTDFELFKYSIKDGTLASHMICYIPIANLNVRYVNFTRSGDIELVVIQDDHTWQKHVIRYLFSSEDFSFKYSTTISSLDNKFSDVFSKNSVCYIEHVEYGLLQYNMEDDELVAPKQGTYNQIFYGKQIVYTDRYIAIDLAKSWELTRFNTYKYHENIGIVDLGCGDLLIENEEINKMQVFNVFTQESKTLDIPLCDISGQTCYYF